MSAALSEMIVTGVPTTIPFHRWALRHPGLWTGPTARGSCDLEWPRRAPVDLPLAAVAAAVLAYRDGHRVPLLPAQASGAWKAAARREALS